MEGLPGAFSGRRRLFRGEPVFDSDAVPWVKPDGTSVLLETTISDHDVMFARFDTQRFQWRGRTPSLAVHINVSPRGDFEPYFGE